MFGLMLVGKMNQELDSTKAQTSNFKMSGLLILGKQDQEVRGAAGRT